MKLRTIEEQKQYILDRLQTPNLSGVECPNCKSELQFVSREVMTSSPPQKDVVCFSCGYKNRIYV